MNEKEKYTMLGNARFLSKAKKNDSVFNNSWCRKK